MACPHAATVEVGLQRSELITSERPFANIATRLNEEIDMSTVRFFSIAMLTAVSLAMPAQVALSQSNMSAHIPHGNTSGQSNMSAHIPHGNRSGQSNMGAHIPHGSTSGQSNMSDVHPRH